MAVPRQEAARLLAEARTLRTRARSEALPLWLPLLIFGAVVCGGVVVQLPAAPTGPSSTFAFTELGRLSFFGGSQPAWYVGLYWMLAIPLGFGLAALLYRRHAHKVGLRDRSLPYVAVGLGLFGALLFLFVSEGSARALWQTHGDLLVRGLLPLLVVSLALGALSVIARSPALGAFAFGFVALTLVANLYDMENLAFRLGWSPHSDWQWNLSTQTGLAVCGLTLLAASAVSFLWTKRDHGAPG